MRIYKFHPISIHDTLMHSLRIYLLIARVLSPFLALMILVGIFGRNVGILYVSLSFVPAACIVILMFLGLEWLDLHFTSFLMTNDTLSRHQYGRVTRRILRGRVTAIKVTADGLMVMTKGPYLIVPDGLVGEDGVSCDIRLRLLEWLPVKS